MKTIDNIKRLLESIEDKQQIKEECPFEKIAKKYSDLPEDKVKAIIEEVKAVMTEKSESDVEVKNAPEVKDAGTTDSLKAMNELCGSESDEEAQIEDKAKEEVVTEDEDKIENTEKEELITEENEVDDDLIISEDDDEIEDEVEEQVVTEEDEEDEEIDDMLAEDTDELDAVDSDEEFEEDYLDECDDIDTKEAMHEANTAAKAAIANEYDGKDTFSSDIDVLTDYLKDY